MMSLVTMKVIAFHRGTDINEYHLATTTQKQHKLVMPLS